MCLLVYERCLCWFDGKLSCRAIGRVSATLGRVFRCQLLQLNATPCSLCTCNVVILFSVVFCRTSNNPHASHGFCSRAVPTRLRCKIHLFCGGCERGFATHVSGRHRGCCRTALDSHIMLGAPFAMICRSMGSVLLPKGRDLAASLEKQHTSSQSVYHRKRWRMPPGIVYGLTATTRAASAG